MGDSAAKLKRVRGVKLGSVTRKCQLALQVINNGDTERMNHLIEEVRQVYKELEGAHNKYLLECQDNELEQEETSLNDTHANITCIEVKYGEMKRVEKSLLTEQQATDELAKKLQEKEELAARYELEKKAESD
jgi:hypothetical protein